LNIANLEKVIAAIWDDKLFELALQYKMNSIFLLQGSINTLPRMARKVKSVGGILFVDIDFVAGLQADEEGLLFLKKNGIDGVITTKTRIVKFARDMNMPVVLRFFAIDSHAVDRGLEQIRNYSPDYVEILPGVAALKVLDRIKITNTDVIAAGLLDDIKDIEKIFENNIMHISTSSIKVWKWFKSQRI